MTLLNHKDEQFEYLSKKLFIDLTTISFISITEDVDNGYCIVGLEEIGRGSTSEDSPSRWAIKSDTPEAQIDSYEEVGIRIRYFIVRDTILYESDVRPIGNVKQYLQNLARAMGKQHRLSFIEEVF